MWIFFLRESLWWNNELNFPKDCFHDFRTRKVFESLILLDPEFYKQQDGFAMGSPLGPRLANVFVCYHEKVLPCSFEFKPGIYRRYVDDTILLFRSKHHIENIQNYSNWQQKKSDSLLRLKKKTSYDFLALRQVGTITNLRLQSTTNQPLAKFLSTLEASSGSHINTTCCLPYHTEHSKFV